MHRQTRRGAHHAEMQRENFSQVTGTGPAKVELIACLLTCRRGKRVGFCESFCTSVPVRNTTLLLLSQFHFSLLLSLENKYFIRGFRYFLVLNMFFSIYTHIHTEYEAPI